MGTKDINPLSKAFNYSFEIIQKTIDEDKRIIEGFATTEDVDREDQVVSLKAVEKALALYQKNPTVRADHGPPPIGTTLKAQAMEKDGHRGLFVQVQIGKNTRACDEAWALIKQGLYKAFSIGGIVKAIKSIYSKSAKKTIQQITEIMISEISITDAPANQACMFTVLGKSVDLKSLEDGNMTDNDKNENENENDSEFSKEVKAFSERMDGVEAKTETMSKDISEIKTILTKQADDHESDEDKKKKKDEEDKAEKADLVVLKKQMQSLGFTFHKDPLRTANNEGEVPKDPKDEPSTPLTITKMLQAKYKTAPTPEVEGGGIT